VLGVFIRRRSRLSRSPHPAKVSATGAPHNKTTTILSFPLRRRSPHLATQRELNLLRSSPSVSVNGERGVRRLSGSDTRTIRSGRRRRSVHRQATASAKTRAAWHDESVRERGLNATRALPELRNGLSKGADLLNEIVVLAHPFARPLPAGAACLLPQPSLEQHQPPKPAVYPPLDVHLGWRR